MRTSCACWATTHTLCLLKVGSAYCLHAGIQQAFPDTTSQSKPFTRLWLMSKRHLSAHGLPAPCPCALDNTLASSQHQSFNLPQDAKIDLLHCHSIPAMSRQPYDQQHIQQPKKGRCSNSLRTCLCRNSTSSVQQLLEAHVHECMQNLHQESQELRQLSPTGMPPEAPIDNRTTISSHTCCPYAAVCSHPANDVGIPLYPTALPRLYELFSWPESSADLLDGSAGHCCLFPEARSFAGRHLDQS